MNQATIARIEQREGEPWRSVVQTQYIEAPASSFFHIRIPSPMAALNTIKFLAFTAAATMLTEDVQWRALSGLTLGALIGGLFGMIMLMLMSSATTTPWQIYAWRFAANLLGGIGLGSLGLLAASHFWDITPGPFLTLGLGFSCGFMSVGIAKKFEAIVMSRLDAIDAIDKPKPLPKDARVIDLTIPTRKLDE